MENAVITSKPKEMYLNGSKVTYACQSSYLMNGESTVFCHNGTWEEAPKCQGEDLVDDNFTDFKISFM